MARTTRSLLDDYPEPFLECRDLHHPWVLSAMYRDGTEIRRILWCPRCDTERVDRWTRRGERIASRYVYDPDYQVQGGVDLEAVRLAVMGHHTLFDSYDDAVAATERRRQQNRKGTQ